MPGQLLSSADLSASHDMVLLDLDGVVYLLGEPIDGAPETIDSLRSRQTKIRFVTNNASRRAGDVTKLLNSKGISAYVDEVTTSAQAAAGLLQKQCGHGSSVLVLGSDALFEEVGQVGLNPVHHASSQTVEAVVQGFGADLKWSDLAQGAVVVRSGALWVATNTDLTMPSPRGLLPGNGTMVATIAAAVGRQPDFVAGKPGKAIFDSAMGGSAKPIVVGDRWDTDVAGAAAAGIPALLVLSGATTPAEVLQIPKHGRPQYLAQTMAGLCEEHPEVTVDGASNTVQCRSWTVVAEDEGLLLQGNGRPLDALRALSEAAWLVNDRSDTTNVVDSVQAVGDQANAVVHDLQLAS